MRSDSNVADILDPFCGTGGLDFGLLRQSRCLVNTFELITIYEFSSAIAMSAVYAGSGNISLFAMFIREKFRKNGALDLGYDANYGVVIRDEIAHESPPRETLAAIRGG